MEEQEIWKVYLIKEWTSVVFGKAKVTRQTIWEVSNLGNVKKNGKLVYPNPNRDYLKIGGFNIHIAVATLFVPNPENKPCVDHINTDTHDNRACNLRWVTHKENMNNKLSRKKNSQSIIDKWKDPEYREKHSGENNPMYGKNSHMWVTNGIVNHLIKVEDYQKYIELGYKSGQTRNH